MSGIKTGNKGFVNPVDGKVYTIDPNGNADEVAASYDPGNMTVDKTVKDINKKTKITLGTYLSNATKGKIPSYTSVPNQYSIDAPTDATLPSSLIDNGYPITPSPTGNSEKFNGNLPSSFSSDFSGLQQGVNKIKKGRSSEASSNGNTLLSSVTKTQNVVTLSATLKDYSSFAFAPNYRVPGTDNNFTTVDILSPPKTFDYKLLKYDSLKKVNPEEEAVVVADLTIRLANVVTTPQTLTLAAKNAYPVSIPENITLSSTTNEKGYPAALTVPGNQNANIFTQNPGSSVSNYYAKGTAIVIQDGKNVTTLLSKGKSEETQEKQLLDGNELFQSIIKGVLPGPLTAYTNAVLEDNTFDPSIAFIDPSINLLSPPPGFQPIINDIDPAEPKGEYLGVQKSPVTLFQLRQKAADVTAANEYSVSPPVPTPTSLTPGVQVTDLSSLTDTNGVPVSLGSFSNTDSFVPREQINPLSTDASLANTSFAKGKNVDASYDGHNLLKTVQGNVNTVANNTIKHSSTAKYEPGSSSGDEILDEFGVPVNGGNVAPADHPVQVYENNGAGVLALGNNRWASRANVTNKFNPTMKIIGTDGRIQEVSHMQMAKVGIGLAQRAAAEIPAWNADKFNPIGDLAERDAALPSVAQLGILKVDGKLLTARDVLDSLNGPEYDVDALASITSITSIAPFDGQSWGNLNSPSEPFDDGISSIGLSLTLLAIVIVVGGLITAIAEVSSNSNRSTSITVGGKLTKGKYQFSSETDNSFTAFLPDAYQIFGIRPTNNNLAAAIEAGLAGFFVGADKANANFADVLASIAGSAVGSVLGDNSSIGANLVVCRTIVRSGLMFAQFTDSVVKRSQLSTVGGIKSAGAVLKVIRSSKLISALNVFASLGDTLLDRVRAERSGVTFTDGSGKPQVAVAGFESVDPDKFGSQSSVTKSRLTFGDKYDTTLAWSTARSPAMYLTNPALNGIMVRDGGKLGAFKGSAGLSARTNGNQGFENPIYHVNGLSNGRISNENRDAMERMLDAEYVPFYFHDVRTNEIVSFHAFLTSLSDDYSAAYDSTEGLGRIEPIKIYKSTTRKIGLSFIIAATSEDDFDHMWFKINKLTTLVYPQWTAGRTMSPDSYKFKAPFSQLPGASPMIRIRLGDLLRSNYSKFALARLFGAGSNNSSTTGVKIPDPSKQNASNASNESSIELDTRLNFSIDEFLRNIPDGTKLDIYKIINNFGTIYHSDKNFRERLVWTSGKKVIISDAVTKSAKSKFVNSDQEYYLVTMKIDDESYDVIVDPKYVIPTNSAVQDYVSRNNAGDIQKIDDSLAAINNFLDNNKNAIAKSFNSAGGKGLAGFIESMNFDWYSSTTWDIGKNRTAPKMCKVTISFSPIHDITPGLDSSGYNRAPIYPVGRAMAPTEEATAKPAGAPPTLSQRPTINAGRTR